MSDAECNKRGGCESIERLEKDLSERKVCAFFSSRYGLTTTFLVFDEKSSIVSTKVEEPAVNGSHLLWSISMGLL